MGIRMRTSGLLSVAGLAVGVGVVAWAHVSMGGDLRMFIQPEAVAVVFGGTLAALLISFPGDTLRAAVAGVGGLGRVQRAPLELLVPAFMNYARTARRQGLPAVELEAEQSRDAYLVRALTLSASGLPIDIVRETLEIEARVAAERDEESAQVLEAAAGYAPTLGIVGAVLGLMRVMQHFGANGAGVGSGIAAAFVATIYGVGAANLIFLNFVHPTLPGVFEGNQLSEVNGALWTLKIEVMFYAAVPLLAWAFRKLGRLPVIAAVYLRVGVEGAPFELIERHGYLKAAVAGFFCLATFYLFDLYDFLVMHDRRELVLRLVQALFLITISHGRRCQQVTRLLTVSTLLVRMR